MSGTEFYQKGKSALSSYKTATLYFCMYSANALGSAIIIALTGAEWSNLKTQERFVISVSIFVNWTNTMMSYMSKKATKEPTPTQTTP